MKRKKPKELTRNQGENNEEKYKFQVLPNHFRGIA